MRLWIVCVVTLGLTRVAAGDSDDESALPTPPAARGTPLVRPDASWRWQLVTAPRVARQLGALAVSGVDVAARRRTTPIAVLGDPVPAPPQWPYAVTGERPTIGLAPDDLRIAAAFGVTTFTLGAADQGLEMLELRLRYEDGITAWINGIEVARRALPRHGGSNALSTRRHGPEWETFYVPVAPGLLRVGPNTFAVEVHPSARRFAPTLVADVVGRRDRGILRGPVLADADQTTAVIAVDTDHDVEAVLEWGVGEARDHRQTSPAGRRHRFKLVGLPPETRIGYRVHAGASVSPRYAFHTMPAAGAAIRIGVYGDVRGGHAIHGRLVQRMLGEGLDAVAVTGDMVLQGSDEADWQRFFAIATELLSQIPYYPAVGNHDVGWEGADVAGRAEQMFALPPGPPDRPVGTFWYSRDLADVHLVFLDSNAYERTEQETWLDRDLARARNKKARAIIVFTHDGPYARGFHGGNAIARDRYAPILARHHVDFVFSGHDHLYQRGELDGLRYVVTGGGGASLYGIRCGVAGRPRCKVDDGMQMVAREYHYVVLTIGRDLELCVRRPDGTLLEKCVRYPLSRV
ncbi:MAG: metallophosphoesterase [Deltaproteobacteria bacterium]|nr:metallophosphoesterase [Deltaproteobacteria bacterium]